jgi:hypothetical protein
MAEIHISEGAGPRAADALSVPCGRGLEFHEFATLKKSASENHEKSRRMTCAVAEENLLQILLKKSSKVRSIPRRRGIGNCLENWAKKMGHNHEIA